MEVRELQKSIIYIRNTSEEVLLTLTFEQKRGLKDLAMEYIKTLSSEEKHNMLTELQSKLMILVENKEVTPVTKSNNSQSQNKGKAYVYGNGLSLLDDTEAAFITSETLISSLFLSLIMFGFGIILQLLIIGG